MIIRGNFVTVSRFCHGNFHEAFVGGFAWESFEVGGLRSHASETLVQFSVLRTLGN